MGKWLDKLQFVYIREYDLVLKNREMDLGVDVDKFLGDIVK